MRTHQTALGTQAFSAALRCEALEERVEFVDWGGSAEVEATQEWTCNNAPPGMCSGGGSTTTKIGIKIAVTGT